MKNTVMLVLVGALLLGGAGLAFGVSQVWDVPSDAPTIQAGIDSAATGDIVAIACGTYYEHDIVMKAGIIVTQAGVPPYGCVVIDAQQLGRVLICEDVDMTAAVVGIGITGGQASGTYPDYLGGGIYCVNSSPHFRDCRIEGNAADYGGGAYCRDQSSPTFENCLFLENTSQAGGGGVTCFNGSSPSFLTCVISGNAAASGGGGVYCATSSSPFFVNCTLFGNDGGAVACWDGSAPDLENCLIAFNDGASLFSDASGAPALSCCDIFGNASDWIGVIADQLGLAGNIGDDPQFCSTIPHEQRSWSLQSDSPCAPAMSGCGLIGARGVGCGTVGVRITSWGGFKARYSRDR
jgi:hypothetical protein